MKLPEKEYLTLFVQIAAIIAGAVCSPRMMGHDNLNCCFPKDVSNASCKVAKELMAEVGIEKGP